jgi:hypothetical protein
MCLQFGFVIFWSKDFGAKAAHKMLVKLTLGWEGLTATDTITYYDTELITAIKSFIAQVLCQKVDVSKAEM